MHNVSFQNLVLEPYVSQELLFCQMLLTCISILAVDFNIFPRRYAKAETYGSGLVNVLNSHYHSCFCILKFVQSDACLNIQFFLIKSVPFTFFADGYWCWIICSCQCIGLKTSTWCLTGVRKQFIFWLQQSISFQILRRQ